ncbi:MAG: hypothetical protein WCB96_09940, partial [Candidatus Aminicenantales bacterium]
PPASPKTPTSGPLDSKGVGGINIFSGKLKGVFGSHPSRRITRSEMLPDYIGLGIGLCCVRPFALEYF